MRMLLGACILANAKFELQPELNSVFFVTVAKAGIDKKETDPNVTTTGYNYNLHGFRLVWRWSIFKFDLGYKGRIVRQFSSIVDDLYNQAVKETKKPKDAPTTYKRIASSAQEFYHAYLKIGQIASIFFGILNPAHLPACLFVETFNYGSYNIYRPMQAGSISDQAVKVLMITFLSSHPILDSVSLLYNIPNTYSVLGRFANFSTIAEELTPPLAGDTTKKFKEPKQNHQQQTALLIKGEQLSYAEQIQLFTLIFRTIFDNSIGTSIYKMFLSTDTSRCSLSFIQKIDESNVFISEFAFGLSFSQAYLQLSRGQLSWITTISSLSYMNNIEKFADNQAAEKEFAKKRIESFRGTIYIVFTLVYYIPLNLMHSLYIGISVCVNKKLDKSLFKNNGWNEKHYISAHLNFGICQNKDAITKEIILRR